MEIERIKAMKALEEREGLVKASRRKRAGEIKEQIVERQNQRLIDGAGVRWAALRDVRQRS